MMKRQKSNIKTKDEEHTNERIYAGTDFMQRLP